MKDVVIVEAARTATGKFGGSLSKIPSPVLGGYCIKSIMEKSGILGSEIDEVIQGIHFQGGIKANGARQSVIYGGLPFEVPAFTPNKNCGTALKAIHLAAQSIQVGDNKVVIAGGAETMSAIPYLIDKARFGYKMGPGELRDSMFYDGMVDPFVNYHMGVTAENVAKKYGITREAQDAFALESHLKSAQAWNSQKFQQDIVPIKLEGKSGLIEFIKDETYREDLTAESLAKLKPAFLEGGTVTPGNASQLNDAAALVLMMSSEKADTLGLKPIVRYVAAATSGVDPAYMGIGPITAVTKLLKKTGLKVEDIGLWELNEAFASQALACINDLGLDRGKVNVNGGAIALGHPVGATGARLTITLIREMQLRNEKYGVVTLCIGGGQGIAMLFELI